VAQPKEGAQPEAVDDENDRAHRPGRARA
jgi:hypothetical protein